MGERGNIVIHDEGKGGSFPHPVYLYTHWSGYQLKQILQAALARKERWEDPQYLSRIIFCQMISAQSDTALTEPTGFGISTAIGDSGYSLLVVHPDNKTIKELDSCDDLNAPAKANWTFDQFLEQLMD